jgi:hypothetical protein
MNKGMYYMPMFLVLIGNIIVSWFLKDWYSLAGWFIALFFLCEVYFLRFLR